MNHYPFGLVVLFTLGLVAAVVWASFLLGGIEYAYQRIGIPEDAMFALLLSELAGSGINIPLTRVHEKARRSMQEVRVFGVRYRVPVLQPASTTTLAVNLGGALIPTGVSLYLLINDSIWWQAAVGVAVVTVVVHLIARPVRGVGIAVPGLIPPLIAAGVSVLVAPHMAAPVAYVAGTLGTLLGADLLNVRKLSSVGSGVASIGGAGTFDGVFLSGIVAVLLVSVR